MLANLGVLIGIVFLAFEINQNTEAIHSQTRATIYSGAQAELWKNIEYPRITLNFRRTEEPLTADEKVQLDAWLTASMRAREFAWLEYKSGNIDQAYWEAELEVIRIVLGTERTRYWWRELARPAFHPEFAKEVDRIAQGPELDYAGKILSIK